MGFRSKVFISYSHDSPEHAARILRLANQLKVKGLDVLLDQYDSHPQEGWPKWMEKALELADFVLLVCTETYLQRVEGREKPGVGRGVVWESDLIYTELYENGAQGNKFIPIIFNDFDQPFIPKPLRKYTFHQVNSLDDADVSYRQLTNYLTGKNADTGRGVRTLRFRLSRMSDANPYAVHFAPDDVEPTTAEFACNPKSERTLSEMLAAVEQNKCPEEDLRYVGSQLWGGLITGDVQTRYKQFRAVTRDDHDIFHFRLSLPRELEDLPWESLYDTSFLATDERSCIIRETPDDIDAPQRWENHGRPLGILLLLPSGTRLDLVREREQILHWAEDHGDAVNIEVMDDQVTPNHVREKIQRGHWDVVHFAGHAKCNDRGEVRLRLNGDCQDEPEHWMEAERFSTLFNRSGVRLVVLNCCHGASVDANLSRALSGLGPFLMRRGIPAIVAMRYEIPDHVALRFCDEFYRQLLVGTEPGRVDLAVESGRAVVYQNEQDAIRGFITPVLYLAEGHERVFSLATPRRVLSRGPEIVENDDRISSDELELPSDLIEALRENRCVPVLGPGLLASQVMRSVEEAVAPGPRELARTLAELSHYPQMDDFVLSERGGAWLDGFVLQWVCQHLFSQKKIKHEMLKTIKMAFQRCRPTKAVSQVASWTVPGFLCTYFDGLLAQAAQEQGKKIKVLNALQAEAQVDLLQPLLIQLRGTWRDEQSLVLTEDRHNQLWDRLADLPEWISNVVQGDYGRSLLFLGVHPRDPLVRRLCAKLINEGSRLRVGPVYFAWPAPTAADESYWENFDVQWLPGNTDSIINALSLSIGSEDGSR